MDIEAFMRGYRPRMIIDGVLEARFEGGLCRECRLWWHSLPVAP